MECPSGAARTLSSRSGAVVGIAGAARRTGSEDVNDAGRIRTAPAIPEEAVRPDPGQLTESRRSSPRGSSSGSTGSSASCPARAAGRRSRKLERELSAHRRLDGFPHDRVRRCCRAARGRVGSRSRACSRSAELERMRDRLAGRASDARRASAERVELERARASCWSG